METIKEINIKNRTYSFYNDIINLDEFDGRNIKVGKKDFNNIDIYYLGYEHKKKIAESDVINSANSLYLRIVDMNGQFEKGKGDAWYLIISDDDDVYKKLIDIFESLKNKIIEKRWHLVKYDKDYMKIKFESNNILPAGKDVIICMAAIIIRAIFARDGKYYPQYKNVSV